MLVHKGKVHAVRVHGSLKTQLSCCFESWNYRVPRSGSPMRTHPVQTAACTRTGSAAYLSYCRGWTYHYLEVLYHRQWAESSAWDQVYALTGSNKAIFHLQPWPGRSALDADQRFSFTWVTWSSPASFKAEWKNVPSVSRGRPQRFVYSSYGWCIPLCIWFLCLNSEQIAVRFHQNTFLQPHQHIREQY